MRALALAAAVAAVALLPDTAWAVTWQVGPTRTLTQLGQVNALPGDVVEIDGNATYNPTQWTRSGAPGNPITIRGVTVAGQRPRFQGGTNSLEVFANHVVVENLELTGGSFRCFFVHGNEIVLRNSVVHDCPAHGVLGADQDTGNFLMEAVEVYNCGNGTGQHSIYVATDEVTFPGSVFKMRFCYVHDATGGNAVKSRAERNELHYNWIEGGNASSSVTAYHALELISPDPAGAKSGWDEALAREDTEVVGNVLFQRNGFYVARIGGDGTGEGSKGRYRFANNTVVTQPGGSAVFRLFRELESVEMHNNAFVVAGAGAPNLMRADPTEMTWVGGTRRVAGQNNWVPTGATNVPAEWTGTVLGASTGLLDAGLTDVRPRAGSPLINAGLMPTQSPAGAAFPNPLPWPLFHPPLRAWAPADAGVPRPDAGIIDIGAYEYLASDGGSGGGAGGSGGGAGGAGGSGGSGGTGGTGGSGGTSGTGGSGGSGGAGGSGGSGGAGGSGGFAGSGGAGGAGGGGTSTGGCTCSSGGNLVGLVGVLLALRFSRPRRRRAAD